MALDMGCILIPVAFPGTIMRFPGTFIPNKQTIASSLLTYPSVSTDVKAFSPIVTVLIRYGIDSDFMQEGLELLCASIFLNPVDRLGNGVSASPDGNPERPRIVLFRRRLLLGLRQRGDHTLAAPRDRSRGGG